MEDLKRLLSPAIVAIVLHGLLISFNLPKQETIKPILAGNMIKIEINAVSPPTVVPKNKEGPKRIENISNAISQKKVEIKKVITQSVVISKQHIKRKIDLPQNERKVSIKDRNIGVDPQNKNAENQVKNINEKHPSEIINKSFATETMAVAHAKNNTNNLEDDLSKEKNSIVPIQKKAIPKYRQNNQPPYPAMAKLRGYEGVILLSVLVNTEGMVSEIKIKISSGHLILDRSALQTVKNWLFTPASEGGKRVTMWVDIPIEFQLK